VTEAALIGLGVMGRNLALNMRERGIAVTAWDPWPEARQWRAEGISVVEQVNEAVAALAAPRLILLLVKAGEPVDDMIDLLRPYLSPGDVIVDLGNSRYSDTEARAARLSGEGLRFAGVGISGGAEGARHGPAMMAGCPDEVWSQLGAVLKPIAAQAGAETCAEWFGPGGAGHFVKMVHNGIEYAVMQAIAEVCHALHFGGGLPHTQIADLLAGADQGYLVEITREILTTADPEEGGPILDVIGDAAGQKGTGGWCVEAALDLDVAVPAIAEAVSARQFSSAPEPRQKPPRRTGLPVSAFGFAGPAIDAATAVALAQGFGLALRASAAHGWDIDTSRMAAAWRAGSILRMPVQERLAASVENAALPAALLEMLEAGLPGLRALAIAAQQARQPVPVLASCLAWTDSLDRAVLPTRMVQAQRDRFGDHGFARTDREGVHHGPWNRTGA